MAGYSGAYLPEHLNQGSKKPAKPASQSTGSSFDWLGLGGLASNVLGNIWGGKEQPDPYNLHLVNQGQQNLWNQMASGLQNGQGDFGFGSNYKQGKSQIQDFMASKGVKLDPNSGVYAGAMGNMTGQALGADAQARNNYAMQLLGTPMQVAQSQGGNFLTGSPSYGGDVAEQQNHFNRQVQGNSGNNYWSA